MGETAKQLSERFGKTLQEKNSLSVNSSDTSVNKSKQLEFSIPQSVISTLSAGEFVGMIADNPNERIALKVFHAEVTKEKLNNSDYFKNLYRMTKIREASSQFVNRNYEKIKFEIIQIAENLIGDLFNNPMKSHLIVQKKKNK
jgi:hypothetical protein